VRKGDNIHLVSSLICMSKIFRHAAAMQCQIDRTTDQRPLLPNVLCDWRHRAQINAKVLCATFQCFKQDRNQCRHPRLSAQCQQGFKQGQRRRPGSRCAAISSSSRNRAAPVNLADGQLCMRQHQPDQKGLLLTGLRPSAGRN